MEVVDYKYAAVRYRHKLEEALWKMRNFIRDNLRTVNLMGLGLSVTEEGSSMWDNSERGSDKEKAVYITMAKQR